jgi:hypothetical protein
MVNRRYATGVINKSDEPALKGRPMINRRYAAEKLQLKTEN